MWQNSLLVVRYTLILGLVVVDLVKDVSRNVVRSITLQRKLNGQIGRPLDFIRRSHNWLA